MGGEERRGGAVEGGQGRYIGEWEGERGGEGAVEGTGKIEWGGGLLPCFRKVQVELRRYMRTCM